jgi:hypothetical protein
MGGLCGPPIPKDLHASGGVMNKHIKRMLKRVAEMLSSSPYRGEEETHRGQPSEPQMPVKGCRKKRKAGQKAA